MPRGISKTIDELVEENDQLMTEVRQWMNEASKYQDAFAHEKNLNAFAFDALKEQLSQKDLLDVKVKTLQEELKGFVVQNQEVKQIIEKLQSQLDQLESSSNSLEASYEARIKELEEELDTNKSDKERLQEQVGQIKSRIAKITDTEEKEDVEDSLTLIEKEIDRLKTNSKQEEIQKLQLKLDKLSALVPENTRLKAEAKALEKARWYALGRLVESQEENVKKDKTIRELQEKNIQLEKENAGVKTVERHSAYYKERLVIAEEKKDKATRMVAETKRENDELRKENSDLVDKNLDQKLKNKELRTENKQQKAIIKKRGKILKIGGWVLGVAIVGALVSCGLAGKFSKDKKDITVERNTAVERVEEVEKENSGLIEDNKAKDETINEITQENKDLTEENDGLTQENKDLTEENNGLKEENKNKDDIIDEKDEQISNLTSREIVVPDNNSICGTIANAYFGGQGSVVSIKVSYNSSTGVAGITFKFRSNITLTETSWQSSITISKDYGDNDAATLAEVEEFMKNKIAVLTEEISTETESEME